MKFAFSCSAVGLEHPSGQRYCHFPYIRMRTLRQAQMLLSISDSWMTVGVSNILIIIHFLIFHRDIRKLTVELEATVIL